MRHDTPKPERVCKQCGYRLEALTVKRCPECGGAFDPDDPTTYAVEVDDAHILWVSTRNLILVLIAGFIVIAIIGLLASLVTGCAARASFPETDNAAVVDGGGDGIDRIAALDVAAAGCPVWFASPQDTKPNGAFKLIRFDAEGRAAPQEANVHLPNIAVAPHDASAAVGTADDVAIALRSNRQFRALRFISQRRLDEYQAVSRVRKALEQAGWREAPNRPGLWVRPE